MSYIYSISKIVPSLDGKRVLAKEVLIVTHNVKAAIKNNNTSEIYMMINQRCTAGNDNNGTGLKVYTLVRKLPWIRQ